MEDFAILISVIFGVLSLILFFKVWGMCNNVSRINKKINNNDDIETTIEFLLRIGEIDRAKDVLLNRILTNETIFNSRSSLTIDEKIAEICDLYKDEIESLGIHITNDKIK